MKITKPEIMQQLARLLEIYPRPRHAPEGDEELARIWHRELGDLDADVVRAGVSAYCRTDADYFPKPGAVRRLGEAVCKPSTSPTGLAAEYAEWERTWAEQPIGRPAPCPVCGAIDGWSQSPPTKRRQVYHDTAKHAAAGIPASGGRAESHGGLAVVPQGAGA